MDEPKSGLKSWASSMKANPVLTKAKALTPSLKPGSVQVPFPVTARSEYLKKIKGAGVWKRSEDAPIRKVPLSSLNAIQRGVNVERLHAHLEDPHLIPKGTRAPGHGGLIDYPLVVHVDGKNFAHDGHHRLTGSWLRGQKDATVRYVDLDSAPDFAHRS